MPVFKGRCLSEQDLANPKNVRLRMELASKIQEKIEELGTARVTITYPVPDQGAAPAAMPEEEAEKAAGEAGAEKDKNEKKQAEGPQKSEEEEQKTDEASQPIERCFWILIGCMSMGMEWDGWSLKPGLFDSGCAGMLSCPTLG